MILVMDGKQAEVQQDCGALLGNHLHNIYSSRTELD